MLVVVQPVGGQNLAEGLRDFPAEHWIHLRTTNPIESTLSTVKLRTKVTRGVGSPAAALAMAPGPSAL